MSEPTSAPSRGGPYSVKQVARIFGVSLTTIYEEIAAGNLVALAIGPGRGTKRIEESALEAYKKRCRAKAIRSAAADIEHLSDSAPQSAA